MEVSQSHVARTRLFIVNKSPFQIRRDEKRSQERRVTRQQARIADKKDESDIEIENPRGEFKDIMNSPSPNHAWSHMPVDIHDTPDISGIISRSSLADQSGYSHVDQCVTKTITELADTHLMLVNAGFSDLNHQNVKSW